MRALTIFPLALLLGACWTPSPGQVDPTRYPWDPRNAAPPPHERIEARGKIAPSSSWQAEPQPSPAEGSYCVMAIEQESQTGITVSANSVMMACTAPANPAPRKPPK